MDGDAELKINNTGNKFWIKTYRSYHLWSYYVLALLALQAFFLGKTPV